MSENTIPTDGVYRDINATVTIEDGKATVRLATDFGASAGTKIPLKRENNAYILVGGEDSGHSII